MAMSGSDIDACHFHAEFGTDEYCIFEESGPWGPWGAAGTSSAIVGVFPISHALLWWYQDSCARRREQTRISVTGRRTTHLQSNLDQGIGDTCSECRSKPTFPSIQEPHFPVLPRTIRAGTRMFLRCEINHSGSTITGLQRQTKRISRERHGLL